MKWAGNNGMRVIDIDPRSTTHYSAVFVSRKAGKRYYVAIGTRDAIYELQESTGTRFQVVNKLEGQDWYGAVHVDNASSQVARIADSLFSTSGAVRIGAYVQEIGGSVLVNLRGTRRFYPCSAIKVLIHAAGIAKVPASQLNTYKINNVLYSQHSQL